MRPVILAQPVPQEGHAETNSPKSALPKSRQADTNRRHGERLRETRCRAIPVSAYRTRVA